MLQALHIASQYLAMAGKSFLPPQADDSHTNLGWETPRLHSRPLTEDSGPRLALDLETYSLCFISESGEVLSSHGLAGHTHSHMLEWVRGQASELGLGRGYSFHLHYELPYVGELVNYSFPEADQSELKRMINMRQEVDAALRSLGQEFNWTFDIRIWPHHFDTGALLAQFEGENMIRSIGFGLAIPDTMCNDFYLYTSVWSAQGPLDLQGLQPLQVGRWKTPDWQGGIAPVTELESTDYLRFFRESAGQLNSLLHF
jgi:hypothetical protein